MRLKGLDLLRIVAALMVVFYHLLYRGWASDNLMSTHFEIGSVFRYGYLGVDLFFFISGFVITYSQKNKSLKDFLISRFIRLYPIYWMSIVATVIILILFKNHIPLIKIIANLTMFQDFLGFRNIDGVYWSLLVELKFYLIIAVALKIFKLKSSEFAVYWLTLGLINYIFNLLDLVFFRYIEYLLILEWAPLFTCGIVCYGIFENRKIKSSDLFLLLAAFLLALFYSFQRLPQLINHYGNNLDKMVVGGYYVIFIILIVYVLKYSQTLKIKPWLQTLVFSTYPIYLIHQMIGYELIDFLVLKSMPKYFSFFMTLMLIIAASIGLVGLDKSITKKLKNKLLDVHK